MLKDALYREVEVMGAFLKRIEARKRGYVIERIK